MMCIVVPRKQLTLDVINVYKQFNVYENKATLQ